MRWWQAPTCHTPLAPPPERTSARRMALASRARDVRVNVDAIRAEPTGTAIGAAGRDRERVTRQRPGERRAAHQRATAAGRTFFPYRFAIRRVRYGGHAASRPPDARDPSRVRAAVAPRQHRDS